MNNFNADVMNLVTGLGLNSEQDLPLDTLRLLAERAGFDTNTKDAAQFAAGVWIAADQSFPVEPFSREGLNLREYGRAVVVGFRKCSLTAFYDSIKSSMEDKLLPADAEATCLANESLGLLVFKFYEAKGVL